MLHSHAWFPRIVRGRGRASGAAERVCFAGPAPAGTTRVIYVSPRSRVPGALASLTAREVLAGRRMLVR